MVFRFGLPNGVLASFELKKYYSYLVQLKDEFILFGVNLKKLS